MNSHRIFLLIAILLTISLPAYSQQEQSKINNLSQQADVILKGRVTDKNAAWNENKTRIYTKVTLQVHEYLKGKEKQKTIEITYPGGEVGDVGEFYTHMPTFEAEEEVLVFLKKDKKNNRFEVIRGHEGKIRITRDIKK